VSGVWSAGVPHKEFQSLHLDIQIIHFLAQSPHGEKRQHREKKDTDLRDDGNNDNENKNAFHNPYPSCTVNNTTITR